MLGLSNRGIGTWVRTSIASAVLATMGLLPGSAALAAQPVDLSTLTPVPFPYYTCQATGAGAVCKGTTTEYTVDGDDGACSQGFEIMENTTNALRVVRHYDAAGNLTERVRHYRISGTLSNSATGRSVPLTADFTLTDDLAIPGDLDSSTSTYTGSLYTVTVPGSGMILHDVGIIRFAPDGNVLEVHGPKMLFFGDTAGICAALA